MSAVAPPGACPVCKGIGVVETAAGKAVACRCRAVELADSRLLSAQVPERYRNCTLQNYIVHRDAPALVSNAMLRWLTQ